jgi:phage antirepressor YoqD-like protein
VNELQIFSNPKFGQIRMVEIEDKPFAVGVDVARMLEYAKPSQAVIDHCKGIRKLGIPSDGGSQETNVITEGDIYRLIVKAADQSKNPDIKAKAEQVERWIFDEVIPQIRKNGVYVAPQVDSKMLYQIAQALEEKEKQIALLTPAAEFGNAVSNNQGGILIRDYAKVLENDGIRIGQDKLFSWLHLNGYIYRAKGYRPSWVPKKVYVEQGLFRVKETPVSSPEHGDWISYTTRLTGKGQKYFYEKLRTKEMSLVGVQEG